MNIHPSSCSSISALSSQAPTPTPPEAPEPARPTKCSLPMLLTKREAPICVWGETTRFNEVSVEQTTHVFSVELVGSNTSITFCWWAVERVWQKIPHKRYTKDTTTIPCLKKFRDFLHLHGSLKMPAPFKLYILWFMIYKVLLMYVLIIKPNFRLRYSC